MWKENWNRFREEQPFKKQPFSKRNWGNANHSLCSFYGKLKPAIAHHLINTFTTESERMLDCFSGSGTLPFEAALNKRKSFALDINPISVVITTAKVKTISLDELQNEIAALENFVKVNKPTNNQIMLARDFGFNKTLKEYYHEQTLIEIINARIYFGQKEHITPTQCFLLCCLLHVLHGNRPYALSRNSHPITPYAPSGETVYKSLAAKLHEKVTRAYAEYRKSELTEGDVFKADILQEWPNEIQNINAIITSPPFYDSTKYYLTNWLRSWFLGWEVEDFNLEKMKFVDTLQKKSFAIYDTILRSCKDRLSPNGVVVFHLGKSHKKDMGNAIIPYAKRYFLNTELYNEDVSKIEKHGILDKGSVDTHQYLIMY